MNNYDLYVKLENFPQYQNFLNLKEVYEKSGISSLFFNVNEGISRNTISINGETLINYCSYNYLGMSGDPIVTEATIQAVKQYGSSVSASRLVSGEKKIVKELEAALSDLLQTEDAIVFTAGHATNEGVISHLWGAMGDERNLILLDEEDHNSILMGSKFSEARILMFKHNNIEHLEKLLEQWRSKFNRVLIVIEGVYSMSGDIPNLPAFIALKKKYGAWLMIDEAHSIGCLGKTGGGIREHYNVASQDVELWMGTLSKALGSCGGYIAGSHLLIEYLKFTTPSFVFSAGITPANCAAALESLRVLKKEPERAIILQQRADMLRELLRKENINIGSSQYSAIIPVITGHSAKAAQLSLKLREEGIFALPVVYPAVPHEKALLRFFISSTHTEEQIIYTSNTIAREYQRIM